MCSVIWCGLSWEAFATLFTGVLAVLAAVVVGRQQIGISAKQTDILDRQVRLQEMSLREALFERRMAVFNVVQLFLADVLRDGVIRRSLESRFLEALGQIPLLFRPQVQEGVMAAYGTAKELNALQDQIRAAEAGSEFPSTPDHLREAEHAARVALAAAVTKLAETFGDEIRLGAEK